MCSEPTSEVELPDFSRCFILLIYQNKALISAALRLRLEDVPEPFYFDLDAQKYSETPLFMVRADGLKARNPKVIAMVERVWREFLERLQNEEMNPDR